MLSDVHISVGSILDLSVSELSCWCLQFISTQLIVCGSPRSLVVLELIFEFDLALFIVLAACDVVLAIAKVEVSDVVLAEHFSASLPKNWAQESVLGVHVLVLAVTVTEGLVITSRAIALGVWDSAVLSITHGVRSAAFHAQSRVVYSDVRWCVGFLRS